MPSSCKRQMFANPSGGMPTRVLVNGWHAVSGGGRSVLNSFLNCVSPESHSQEFVVLVRNPEVFRDIARPGIRLITMSPKFQRVAMFPALYGMMFPRLLRRWKIQAILNFGDLPIPTAIPQLYYFDWPYAVYDERELWNRQTVSEYATRWIKRFIIRRLIRNVTAFVVQSNAIRKRLEQNLGYGRPIYVLPNPRAKYPPSTHTTYLLPKNYFTCLCLSNYYSHKNLEILLMVAQRIQQRNLPIKIVLTIEASQGKRARALLAAIANAPEGFPLVNIGSVTPSNVESIVAEADAILLPTLAECFSGTYTDAMAAKRPILTSRRDFAEDVCGNAAIYFDPHSPEEILQAIESIREDPKRRADLISLGEGRLASYPSWEMVAHRIQEELSKIALRRSQLID
jgi:glycosyltransferase involved in cell wall biosynthesis